MDELAAPGTAGPERVGHDQAERGVARLDRADPALLGPRLTVCLHAQEWADAVLAGRPFGSASALEATAAAAASRLSDTGLATALAAHPRIGERPAGDGAAATHSRREQAGVSSDAGAVQRLREVNRAYEERFGHVFLIRAVGRDVEDVLAAAEERLGNDPAAEADVVREQLGQIAVLRLHTLLDELATEGTTPMSTDR